MGMHLFSGFKYELGYTPTKKSNCVTISFTCDGYPIKRYIFVPKSEGVDCIEVAKNQIERERDNGKLARYVKKYNRKNKKPALITITSVLGAAALVVGGVLIYKYVRGDFSGSYTPSPLEPEDIEWEVTNLPEGYEVNLSNLHSVEGKEYQTSIDLAIPTNDATSYYLPEEDNVEVYCDDTLVQKFNYNLSDDALSAELTVPADEVKGQIKITLTLVTQKPIAYINIYASEGSVGVEIPPQKIASGEISDFTVEINKDPGHDLSVPKIAFGETTLTLENGDYTVSQQEAEKYFINLLGEPYTIVDDIYITAIATEPTVREIAFVSDDLSLYDEELNPLSPTHHLDFDEEFEAYVGIKENTANVTDNVPLDLNIFDAEESVPLIFGKDYLYEFVDNNFAKLTIFAGSNNVIIQPSIEPETTLASFIYHIPANSLDTSLDFEFSSESESTIEIDWGDSDSTIVTGTDTYYACHTFVGDDTDKDYVIKLKQTGETQIPDRFGFNVYDDVIGDDKRGYFSPDEDIAPYCSGIENIVAAKINDNVFKGFTGEGLIHTSIRSLYIPDIDSKFINTKFLNGGDGKYLSYCEDLDNFYVSEENKAYKLAENNKLLLELGSDGDANPIYNVVSLIGEDEDGVTLDNVGGTPIVGMYSYASVGCKNITSLTLGEHFNSYGVGAIIDCPNLSEINIDDNNSKYFTGDKINMIVSPYHIDPSLNGELYLIIRAKTEGKPFYDFVYSFRPFCVSGSNTPSGFINSEVSPVSPMHPYSFYRASNIVELKIGRPSLYAYDHYTNAYIYGCENLKKIDVIDGFTISDPATFTYGIIQKCPNIETIHASSKMMQISFLVLNNAIYSLDKNNGLATLIGTCTNSDIVNTFTHQDVTYHVNNIVTCAFNGNKVKNIYIPNQVIPTANVYPFVGCDGSIFTSNNSYFDVRVFTDETTGLPIESIVYSHGGDFGGRKSIVGVSLLHHNKTLVIPRDDTVGVATYAFAGSSATKVVFEDGDTQLYLDNRSLYSANNIQELDFSKLVVDSPDDVPSCDDMFDNDYYYSTVKVYVKDNTAKELFSNDPYWSEFAEYGNIIVKE